MDMFHPLSGNQYSFDNFIGQREISNQLTDWIKVAKANDKVFPDILLSGRWGMGKLRLAKTLANELGRRLSISSPEVALDTATLIGLLANVDRGELLVIEEIHLLEESQAKMLVDATRKREIQVFLNKDEMPIVPVEEFTLVGLTESPDEVDKQIRPLLTEYHLSDYSKVELSLIAGRRARELGYRLDEAAAEYIANRSDGAPGQVVLLFDKVKEHADFIDRRSIDLSTAKSAIDAVGGSLAHFTNRAITDQLLAMTGDEFERLVAKVFVKLGFQVDHTGGPGDHGLDLVLTRGSDKIGVQCKRWTGTVGESVVRDLYGSIVADESVSSGAVVCTSEFSPEARDFVRDKSIRLVGLSALVQYMREHRLQFNL